MNLRSIENGLIDENVLEKSRIHKILLLFHIPSVWPPWKLVAALFFLIAIVYIEWWVVAGQSLVAAALLTFFVIIDAVLFRLLPVYGLSYGPWQSQLVVLASSRSIASILCSIVAVAWGHYWGLVALLSVQLLGSTALIWGTLIEPFRLQLTKLEVINDQFDASSDQIRILQISDLHVERLTKREDNLLRLVEDSQPDLILITGDYLNLSFVHDARAQNDVHHLLGQLAAPSGVFAVLGSPTVDDRNEVPLIFDDLPVRLLRNEWHEIELDNGRRLILLGVECSHYLPLDAKRLSEVVDQAPSDAPRILLYHSPDLMPEASEEGIDLYLCGHTHGGQVRLPFYGALLTSSQLGKRYEMGLYQNERTNLYVSRGVGLEGLSAPRIRFLAPPEITLITIGGSL